DASLRSLGRHRLKDLLEAQEIFQLCHPKLRDGFGPLQSLNERNTNLPAQRTSFVGRAEQVAEVAALILQDRLVTLVGAGGAGKTRLALQTAAEVADKFADGVWLVELAPVTDGASVDGVIAAVLGVVAGNGRSEREAVIEFVRDKSTLLLVDNCE